MDSKEVNLWVNSLIYDAISEAKGMPLSQVIEKHIDALFSELPTETQQKINALIQEDEIKQQAEIEARRRFSILRIIENGEESYYSLDHADVLYICTLLRKHLRKEISMHDVLRSKFTCISKELYGEYADEREHRSKRILGCMEILLDKDLVWLDIICFAGYFRPKDVSTAVYYATRGGLHNRQAAIVSLMRNLRGKALNTRNEDTRDGILP